MNDGRKRKPQKHKNKTAFKVQFDPQAELIHHKVSQRGLCQRCIGVMDWKIKFNKYKKMTEPTRCNFCKLKNVLRSYMHVCDICMLEKNVCPKCMDIETKEQVQTKLNAKEQKFHDAQSQRKMNDLLKTLKERSRRTVKRLYAKNKVEWDSKECKFMDEDGNVFALQFKHGFEGNNGDIDEFADDDGNDEDWSDEEDMTPLKVKRAVKEEKQELSDPQETEQQCQPQKEETPSSQPLE